MEKLYDTDAYISEFSAKVEYSEKLYKLWKIALDRTAFFPNAGGQDCDCGTLDGQEVVSVEIENDIVYHFVKNEIAVGKNVVGKVDFEKRFRNMQHHSAEHIVSGIVNRLLGYDNVGFHLSSKEVTMDYNGVLSDGDITRIEILANKAVTDNIGITAEYPPIEALADINYRSKLDLTENVRIVTIGNVDVCACCAPHVKRTGEIGLIKLKDPIHYKGGMRIRMICGADALADYNKKQENVVKISNMLSAKQDEISDSVQRVIVENEELKQKLSAAMRKLVLQKAAELSETDGNICVFENDLDTDSLRLYVNEGKKKCRIFVGCVKKDGGYCYIIGSNCVNLRNVASEMNKALFGRGGGKPDMLQGFFGCEKTKITEYFKNCNIGK